MDTLGTWQMDYAGFNGDIVKLKTPFVATIEEEDGCYYLTNTELSIRGAGHTLYDAQMDVSRVLHHHLDRYANLKIDEYNTYTQLLKAKAVGDYLLHQGRLIRDKYSKRETRIVPDSSPGSLTKHKVKPKARCSKHKYEKVGDENGNKVMRYRKVVEDVIGRPIPKGYGVHHINGKHKDDRPCNLYLCTWDEHITFHQAKKLPKLESNLSDFRRLDKCTNCS